MIAALLSTEAAAEPVIRETVVTYKVYGNTFSELRDNMKQDGPNGYWAYTSWYVNWTSSCRVTVQVKLTIPELADRAALTSRQLEQWDQMMVALIAHEKIHASYGISAAKEIEHRNCNNAQSVIKSWNQRDLDLDRNTDHGRFQGVELPQ